MGYSEIGSQNNLKHHVCYVFQPALIVEAHSKYCDRFYETQQTVYRVCERRISSQDGVINARNFVYDYYLTWQDSISSQLQDVMQAQCIHSLRQRFVNWLLTSVTLVRGAQYYCTWLE